ncbi:MAG TPA: isocitrate lyase [Candidatus Thermoplasmatota archaeon]|nr:isocitrate lyase [Candidatus Thermoplasmatota archaeon]
MPRNPTNGRNAPSAKDAPRLGTDAQQAAEELRHQWEADPRWKGIQRDHSAEDVVRLRGSVPIEHSIARRTSERFWGQLHELPYIPALGALTGGQAVQMVRAGLQAIYLSGWQVAADNNSSAETYPDLSLYPVDSVPNLVKRINNALLAADRIETMEQGQPSRDWMAPIVADAEAGFGGPLNAFELMRHMVEAGAAAVHFEDQLSTAKKCGHMGGKVLVPTRQHIRALRAARLAADVMGVPSLIVARTDALGAKLLSSDCDERDQPFLTGAKTREGLYQVRPGLESAIARGLSYAPYADLIWFETSKPDLEEAKQFAKAIHKEFPGKMLAYNCSPSFHWRKNLDDATIAEFQPKLGKLGYKFQFVTLAGFHAMNSATYELAHGYSRTGMSAYVDLQEQEFAMQPLGYTAVAHQKEVGAGYFDAVARVIAPGDAAQQAMEGSTEEEQFQPETGEAAASESPGRNRSRPKVKAAKLSVRRFPRLG